MTLWRRYGIELVKPLIYSGLSYTAGGVLEFLRMPTLIPGVLGPHELLHIGVMAGIGFHFRFLFGVLRATVAPPPADVALPLGPHHPM
jgi:predicted membrane channel-forming protein YqfA (hemolysin III family)